MVVLGLVQMLQSSFVDFPANRTFTLLLLLLLIFLLLITIIRVNFSLGRQQNPKPFMVKSCTVLFLASYFLYTPCPRNKQATLIFAITLPSVEIVLQFLKHFVRE